MAENLGINLAWGFVEAQMRAYELNETRNRAHLDKLGTIDTQNEVLHKLVSLLTNLKESKSEADAHKNRDLKDLIDQVEHHFPKSFDGISDKYHLSDKGKIDAMLQALDSRVKMQVTAYNETIMYIDQGYKESMQYTENAQTTLKMMHEHMKSILERCRVR
jgi:hypothetical protein